MEVTVTFTPTFKDEFLAIRAFGHKNPIRSLYFYVLFGVFPAFLLISMWLAPGLEDYLSPYVFVLILSIILVLCQPVFNFAIALWVWRTTPFVHGEHTYRISEDGLRLSDGGSEIQLDWKAIHRCIETRKYFLFLPSGAYGYWLPTSAISSIADHETIRSIIRERCKKHRLLHDVPGPVEAT